MSDLAERAADLKRRIEDELDELEARVKRYEAAVETATAAYNRSGHALDSTHLGNMEHGLRNAELAAERVRRDAALMGELLEAAALDVKRRLIYVCRDCGHVMNDGLWDETDLAENGPPACPSGPFHTDQPMEAQWVVRVGSPPSTRCICTDEDDPNDHRRDCPLWRDQP